MGKRKLRRKKKQHPDDDSDWESYYSSGSEHSDSLDGMERAALLTDTKLLPEMKDDEVEDDPLKERLLPPQNEITEAPMKTQSQYEPVKLDDEEKTNEIPEKETENNSEVVQEPEEAEEEDSVEEDSEEVVVSDGKSGNTCLSLFFLFMAIILLILLLYGIYWCFEIEH